MAYYSSNRYNEAMFLVGILTWWYSGGWRQRAALMAERIAQTNDYFSIGLLLRTLFTPFRQISAGSVDGAWSVQIRALFDQLISRIVGAVVRSFMVIIGCIVICLQAIFGAIILAAWALVPLLPIAGLVMMALGWVPIWR